MADNADQGVRHLVLVHGREQARAMVEPEQRRLVDIAAEVLADEDGRIGITYSGFCLTGLPHKRLADNAIWTKAGHRVTLTVTPGHGPGRKGESTPRFIGVPYGARARMILLYLQTQAIRTGSREVELGRSMRNWLGRMGLSWGGETGRTLREQAARIAACTLRFDWQGETAKGYDKGGFVRSGLRFHARSGDEHQPSLWEDRVVLDEVFYEVLRQHPVPLREAALRELADRSVSLDIYIWLAYRLHTLDRPTPIRWAALREQFGNGAYGELSNFKREFRKALAPAVVAYPEATVHVEEAGLILYPSRPPVAPRLVALGSA
ncbi:replication protein RepA [Paracraurococcus lichenis]|uniref:Replication protein RepA n=1 Tax=Paracraurococcus lichenis TaxID=3064888 RepID=A0ABT9ECT8_9PROT|nr:replication protein RepA [Paracraurococcus sp. LOR1-02]MDO9714024.1 replication protein RepA [Paracraurococcus sp. LOR1-02]